MNSDDWSGRIGDVLTAPLGELIAGVGRGVADAQTALNQSTMSAIKQMYSGDDPTLAEMALLGYTPQWYAIPECEAEMQIALSITGNQRSSGALSPGAGGSISLVAVPVDAQFQNQFQYDMRAASRIKFKIVPVPPSNAAAAARVVPDVVGQTYADAVARLAGLEIPHVVTGWRPPEGDDGTATPPANATVLEATPSARSVILEGVPVELSLEVVLPNLVGMTYADAVAALDEMGIGHDVSGWTPPAGEEGTATPPADALVQATTPTAGELLAEGARVNVQLPA